jgi:hypothetical protein
MIRKIFIVPVLTLINRVRRFLGLSAADKAMSTYLGLRNLALSNPFAVLMDLPTTQHTATVVAYADGTASIYISNGGGYLGGSESYKAIQDAGLKMILIARKFQPTMQLTKQFPLPEGGVIFFYVVTIDGVYTARAPQEELNQRTHPLTELYAAGQEIITQYRLNVAKK